MKLNISDAELEQMSYDDVAYAVLKHKKSKMKIQDLFKSVIDVMHLPESDFENHIGDFFELLSTDKRFLMLEKGFWDLKENHKSNVVIEEDDEIDEEIKDELEEDEEEESEDINYDSEDIVDDDETDDDLKDLVILDDDDTEETDNM